MIFLKKIRGRIAKVLMCRQKKLLHREIKTINLNQAKSIGIVFDTSNKNNYDEVKFFVKQNFQKEKNVQIIGFIPEKVKQHNYISDKNYLFYSIKECSFFMKPQKEEILNFVDEKLDLLLVLTTHYYQAIHWIVSLSKAGLKAGGLGPYQDDLDFMIELKEPSVTDLLQYLAVYLKDLNSFGNTN